MIPGLLAITPGDGRDLFPWVEALAAAGLPGLLVLEPASPEHELRRLISACLVRIPFVAVHARNPAAPSLVDSHRNLALHCRPFETTTRAIFGVSCHSAEEVEHALSRGATYTLLSPVWSPGSKPDDTRAPLGPAAYLAVARDRPVLALGGITPERHRALVRAGSAGSAVLGGLFSLSSPAAAAHRLGAYLRD